MSSVGRGCQGAVLAVLLWLLLPAANAAPVAAQVRLLTPTPIYLGQQVTVEIELQVAGWFAGATEQPLFTLDDALVVRQPTFATNGFRRIDGRGWATQTWQRSFFPQREGNWQFPAQRFTLRIGGDDGEVQAVSVSSPPLQFSVTALPGPAPLPALTALPLVADQLQLEAQWPTAGGDYTVGSVVRQRIALRGSAVSNGLLPDLPALLQRQLPDAVTLYASELQRGDEWQGGDLQATVVWQLDYLLAAPGSYQLPGVELAYWQPQQRRWTTVTAAPLALEVGTATVAQRRAPWLPTSAASWGWLLVALSTLLSAAAMFVRWRRQPARRAWRQLRRRLRSGASSAAGYQALNDYLRASGVADSASAWAVAQAPSLCQLVAALNSAVGAAAPLPPSLAWRHWRRPLQQWRTAQRRRRRRRGRVSLPPLNPHA